MKYDHTVKYKGVFYPTGANVPVEEAPIKESEKGQTKQVNQPDKKKK